MNKLKYFIILFFFPLFATAQIQYKLGIEVGGDVLGQSNQYSLHNIDTANNIKEIAFDQKEVGGSIFLNNLIFFKQFYINAGVGLSLLSHTRAYDIDNGGASAFNFKVKNQNLYMRYRLTLNYRFKLSYTTYLNVGLGCSAQDYLLDYKNKSNRAKFGVVKSEQGVLNRYDQIRKGKIVFTPMFTLGLTIPVKEHEFSINYNFYYRTFTQYDISMGIQNSSTGSFVLMNPTYKGYNNHSVSLAFNFGLFNSSYKKKVDIVD